jgi:hypothetical protein
MKSAMLVHPQLSAASPTAPYWPSGVSIVAKLWRELFKDFRSSYRPELHYMRGPGPRWREKHGFVTKRDGTIQVGARERKTDLAQRHPAMNRGATGRLGSGRVARRSGAEEMIQ